MISVEIDFGKHGRFGRDWLEANVDRAQELLSACKGTYPLCMCRKEGLRLYISQRQKLHLARFPNSGPKHAPYCPEYEVDPSQCGRGLYAKEAIVERSDGTITASLDVPFLIRGGGGQAPSAPPTAADPKPLKEALGLKGLLDLMLEKAEFNRWVPAMQGRRHYRQFHRFLMEASQRIIVRREPLTKHLYIPEPYRQEDAAAIEIRRKELFQSRTRNVKGVPQRLLVVAQVRAIAQSEYGDGLRFANLPSEFVVWLERDASSRLRKHIDFACVEWPALNPQFHILVALTRRRTPRGYWVADDIAGLACTQEYIPVSDLYEAVVIRRLIDCHRSFFKPLAYDGDPSRYPTVVLTDVGEQSYPLEIVSGNLTQAATRRLRVDEAEHQGRPCWVWIPSEEDTAPSFPIRRSDALTTQDLNATGIPAASSAAGSTGQHS